MKKIGKLKLLNLNKEELDAKQQSIIKGGVTCTCCCGCEVTCSCWCMDLDPELFRQGNFERDEQEAADANFNDSRILTTYGY